MYSPPFQRLSTFLFACLACSVRFAFFAEDCSTFAENRSMPASEFGPDGPERGTGSDAIPR